MRKAAPEVFTELYSASFFQLVQFSKGKLRWFTHCQTTVSSLIIIGHVSVGSNTKESHFHTNVLFMNNSALGTYSLSSSSPMHTPGIFFSLFKYKPFKCSVYCKYEVRKVNSYCVHTLG